MLSSQDDGVLPVLDARNTGKGSISDSVRHLEYARANVLGVVMKNVKATRGSYYSYRYENELRIDIQDTDASGYEAGSGVHFCQDNQVSTCSVRPAYPGDLTRSNTVRLAGPFGRMFAAG